MPREYRVEKIREMTVDEVRQHIVDLKEELFNLRFRNTTRQLENPLKIREVKRSIARFNTILNEHERGVRTLASSG